MTVIGRSEHDSQNEREKHSIRIASIKMVENLTRTSEARTLKKENFKILSKRSILFYAGKVLIVFLEKRLQISRKFLWDINR